jgi:hypothetical protein
MFSTSSLDFGFEAFDPEGLAFFHVEGVLERYLIELGPDATVRVRAGRTVGRATSGELASRRRRKAVRGRLPDILRDGFPSVSWGSRRRPKGKVMVEGDCRTKRRFNLWLFRRK